MISATELACTVGEVLPIRTAGADVADLEVALNYGQAMGSPPLLRFVTEHTEVSWHSFNSHI